MDAPVVEHFGNVLDLGALRGQPQDEVVVLAALASLQKPSQSLQPRPAHAHDVPHIVLRPLQRGGPLGFEKRQAAPALLIELVLVGVDEVWSRRRIDGLRQPQQGLRREDVIVIEEHDKLALGQREGIVRGVDDVARRLAARHFDFVALILQRLQPLPRVRPAGGVVADAKLPMPVPLALHGIDGRLQKMRGGVMHRHDDGNQRPARQLVDQHAGPRMQPLQLRGFRLQPLPIGRLDAARLGAAPPSRQFPDHCAGPGPAGTQNLGQLAQGHRQPP